MFSFRTSEISEQLDRALRDGRVVVIESDASWNPSKRMYTGDIFRQRGNLLADFRPCGEHIDFDMDIVRTADAIVVDIQDTGCRYFNYTIDILRLISMLGSLDASPSLYIVDHRNPAGRLVEGTIPAGETDQWTPKVAHRHGLTLGELAHLYHSENSCTYPLHIISAYACATEGVFMPWAIPPSDDIAGLFTCEMYPGGCLWLDTTITPGIGTLRPYEFIGAPFIKPVHNDLPSEKGVVMRPCSFTPAFGRYEGELCHGYQILLTPEAQYRSLMHTIRLMGFFSGRYSEFTISEDLYTRLADPVIAEYLKGNISFDIVEEHVKSEEQKWIRKAKRYLLYEDQPCRIK